MNAMDKRKEKLLMLMLMVVILVDLNTVAIADVTENFGTGFAQSPHNFSHASWLPTAKICHVCHTYHNEKLPTQQYSRGLLWQSTVFSVTYVMYHSYWGAAFFDTRDKTSWTSLTGKRSNLPDGLSKLCLACHDGIIAPDVFRLHHFVSSEYDVKKINLRDPYVTRMGMSGSISEVLDGGKIQCTSCHDVHGVESFGDTKLLRAEKPMLCITCHKITIQK
jgi:predicted CXXCH cytochrome family protein